MTRFLILTVGPTHSGKSTFAQALSKELDCSLVIDQDNHAEFINQHYKALTPKTGTNTFKFAISETVLNYAIENTSLHLILCNSNRYQESRLQIIEKFQQAGFLSMIVYFDISPEVLEKRVTRTQRSKSIFRHATSFEELLKRQQQENMAVPQKNEVDHFFHVKENSEVPEVIEKIVQIVESVKREDSDVNIT